MAETRITYHKEVKTASFQGKPITLENLTPALRITPCFSPTCIRHLQVPPLYLDFLINTARKPDG